MTIDPHDIGPEHGTESWLLSALCQHLDSIEYYLSVLTAPVRSIHIEIPGISPLKWTTLFTSNPDDEDALLGCGIGFTDSLGTERMRMRLMVDGTQILETGAVTEAASWVPIQAAIPAGVSLMVQGLHQQADPRTMETTVVLKTRPSRPAPHT